jgi:DNA-binding MarR family transcriptional regulator
MSLSSEAGTATAQMPSQASVLIARIARVVRQRFEQVLTPLGLSQRDVIALTYLRGHGPTPQQLLAERLRLDASSMVCLLNVLEESELVVRRRDRADRRRAIVQLSDKGERTLCEVDRAVDVVEQEMLTGLDPDERSTLHRLLARLHFGVTDWIADDVG